MSDRTEEEQIALIKDWWKRNGTSLVVGVCAAVCLVVGWNFWQNSQTSQAQNASALYLSLLENSLNTKQEVDIAEATSIVGELRTTAKGSHAQQYAELILAKLAVEEDRLEEAAQILAPVVENPADPITGELARQRLARVLSAQEKYDEALALFSSPAPEAFTATREEVRGDILVQANRLEEAHSAYTNARKALTNPAAEGALLMKLDDLPAPNKDA